MSVANKSENGLQKTKSMLSSLLSQQNVRSTFKEWLIRKNPHWSSGTVSTMSSHAFYLYNNNIGVSLEEALTDEDGILRAGDALQKHLSDWGRYIRPLQMLKEFIREHLSETPVESNFYEPTIPESIIDVLTKDYSNGFRFDNTAVRLLSGKTGIEIDDKLQNELKQIMFRRRDDIYFLLDAIADTDTRNEILSFAGNSLEDCGCFEISVLHKLFSNRINEKCFTAPKDFEDFYKSMNRQSIRFTTLYSWRITRLSNKNITDCLVDIAKKIIDMCNDHAGAICKEDIHDRFPLLSAGLVSHIIHSYARELITTEITGNTYYQTFDALDLPNEFSETIAEILAQIDDIGLVPSEDIIHTLLSARLNMNFKSEYNIKDNATFRRVITKFYKYKTKRKWNYNMFEVAD